MLRDLSWLGLAWDEGSINHHHLFGITKLYNSNAYFLFYVLIGHAKVDIFEHIVLEFT